MDSMFGTNVFGGFTVYTDPNLTKTIMFRRCRSKKKRIVKKWKNNPRNYRTWADTGIYIMGNRAVCHPVVVARLKLLKN